MFKEMTHEEMLTVDGGHTGYNERPENFDSDNADDNAKLLITTAQAVIGTTGGLGIPAIIGLEKLKQQI